MIPLGLPPLRERGEDILLLARDLLLRYAKEENKRFRDFDAETARVLLDYPWPGNVRELQNVVRNIVVLNDRELVSPDILPPPLNGTRAGVLPVPALADLDATTVPARPNAPIRPLWLVEKEAIEQAIASCDGNIPKAAALLEISPSTIYRKKQGWEEASQR
ncbi:Regulatory protein LuxO [compost metagenome]